MVKIYDSNYKRKAIIKKAYDTVITKEINGENTFNFKAIIDDKTSLYINESYIVEVEQDYFDIAYYEKDQNEDGTLTCSVETEHISYRLNDPEYNVDSFNLSGTPEEILTSIIDGTPFTIGTVEPTEQTIYLVNESKSRRALLMEFVDQINAEVDFNKFEISILNHVGSTERKILAKGKNIKVVGKIYSKRDTDSNGNPLVSYKCTPIQVNPFDLGDEVLLVQNDLGIKEQLRIVKISYNPEDNIEAEIEISNLMPVLENQFYNITTTKLTKGKLYNGVKFSEEFGIVATRSDGKVETSLNATGGISIKTDRGSGLEDTFYVDENGVLKLVSAEEGLANAQASIDVNAQNITLKVSKDNVISEINQSAEEIKISASKVDISGLVTFSNLIDGVTVVSGDNIKTGKISADFIDTDIQQVNSLLYIGEQGSTDTKEIRFATGARIRGGSDGISPWVTISALSISIGDEVNVTGSLSINGSTAATQSYVTSRGYITLATADGRYTRPYYSGNYCHVDASSNSVVFRQSNGTVIGTLTF